MWATYDDTNFPRINVKLQGVPENNDDFDDFLTKWDSYNSGREGAEYIFVFDTSNVGMVNPKYTIKMSKFIKNLKKNPQFLKASVITCSSRYTRFLLRLIFLLQKPVANVYITTRSDTLFIDNLSNSLLNGRKIEGEDITVVNA